MITADVIAIITLAACILLGAALGFGKGLRFITGGIFGKIISIVICYFLFGIVLSFGFVQDLLLKFTTALSENGSWICNLLLNIRIDLIVFAIALFIVVQILRKIVVRIIANVMEMDNKVLSVINRLLGVVLLAAFAAMITLIVFQIIAWISGTDGAFFNNLQDSAFGLDKLFVNNPLNSVFESIRMEFAGGGSGE
ncbi:MAG: hypothetical protein J6Y43_06960 [Clostridia bacterium]|nr:hypothetical protein [Clostridia bacterium]